MNSHKFDACLSLVDGFVSSIPLSRQSELHKQYLLDTKLRAESASAKRVNNSFDHFASKELRIIVINKLLESEYAYLFLELDPHQTAELMGLDIRAYNELSKNTLRKIQALTIRKSKHDFRSILRELEELYYIDYTQEDINE